MSNFKEDILKAAGDDPIEAIVIGHFGWDWETANCDKKKLNYDKIKNTVLSWEDAEKYLNYKYNNGYGIPDCHAITAWTKNKILFVVQYDGTTNIHSAPRNPIDHTPVMPGG